MKRPETLLPWLACAALFEWLVARTFARAAIFMPKPDGALPLYQALGFIGQVAASLTGLLALVILGWIAWQSLGQRKNPGLGIVFLGLIVSGLFGLLNSSGIYLTVFFQTLYCLALLIMTWHVWRNEQKIKTKVAVSLVALTLLAGRLYQLIPLASAGLGSSAAPASAGVLFNGGELLVLLSILGLWWSYGRKAPLAVWLCAVTCGLLFTIPRLLNPTMTGVMAIWSTGLSLYLPWPAYSLGIVLASVTAIQTIRQKNPVGWAVILLAAGGYAPQLSVQAMLGLIALWALLPAEPLTNHNLARNTARRKIRIPSNGESSNRSPSPDTTHSI